MYIEIFKQGVGNVKKIKADGDMFSNEVEIIDFYDRVEFRRTGLDFLGKGYNLSKQGKFYYTSMEIDLPIGVCEIDEESDEDTIIIYKH